MQEPEKQCTKCREWLPYSNFYRDNNTKLGLRPRCKKCTSEQCKKFYSPIAQRRSHMSAKYGITLAQYDRMFTDQGGVCAICRMPEKHISGHTKSIQPLSVDHDHRTGVVRMLLCNECNGALGYMQEDPERIRALLRYAEWCQTREPDQKIVQLSMLDDAS